jgi:hypothetical protein
MTIPEKQSISPETSPESIPSRTRIRAGVVIAIIGFLLFLLGAKPSLFGFDRSHVVGFIQTSVFVGGLAVLCLGGYIGLIPFWKNGERTIAADIGLRLVVTGFLISAVAGLADVVGMGTQPPPRIPFFGPWQATGVQVGQVVIAIGFLMLIPYQRAKKQR